MRELSGGLADLRLNESLQRPNIIVDTLLNGRLTDPACQRVHAAPYSFIGSAFFNHPVALLENLSRPANRLAELHSVRWIGVVIIPHLGELPDHRLFGDAGSGMYESIIFIGIVLQKPSV